MLPPPVFASSTAAASLKAFWTFNDGAGSAHVAYVISYLKVRNQHEASRSRGAVAATALHVRAHASPFQSYPSAMSVRKE
jgi:hypothetical protein